MLKISPDRYKTLPATENEKEQYQSKFYSKSSGELMATKNLDWKSRNNLFHSPDWVSAQKVRLRHTVFWKKRVHKNFAKFAEKCLFI